MSYWHADNTGRTDSADLFGELSILYNLWSSVVSVSSVCNLIVGYTLFIYISV